MRTRIAETSILFISVLKWFALASLVGLLVGGSTALFLWCLQWTTGGASWHPVSLCSPSCRSFSFRAHCPVPGSRCQRSWNRESHRSHSSARGCHQTPRCSRQAPGNGSDSRLWRICREGRAMRSDRCRHFVGAGRPVSVRRDRQKETRHLWGERRVLNCLRHAGRRSTVRSRGSRDRATPVCRTLSVICGRDRRVSDIHGPGNDVFSSPHQFCPYVQ